MARRNYPSRSARVSSKKPAILWGLALAALLAAGAWLAMPAGPQARRSPTLDADFSVAAAGLSTRAPAAGATHAARRIYPYSVVPGGVANGAELARVVKSDKVVAAHYAQFNVAAAHEVKVGKARAVHVSYRKGGKIYWTANKVTLPAGETLLSDGVNEARTRCANRISDTAQLPVAADEPSAAELDSSIEEASMASHAGSANKGNMNFGSGDGSGPALALHQGQMDSMGAFGDHLLPMSSASGGRIRGAGAPALTAPLPSIEAVPQPSGNNNNNNPPDTILAGPPAGNGSGGPAAPGANNPPASTPGAGELAGGPGNGSTPPRFADDTPEGELPSKQPPKPEPIKEDLSKVFPPGTVSTEPADTTGAAAQVPEPASAGLVIGTLALLGLARRRRARQAKPR